MQEQITRAQAQDDYAKQAGYQSWDDLTERFFKNREVYLFHSESAYDYWQTLINSNI